MYNGIGLQTPRGSGTSGYIQANVSINQKRPHSTQKFLAELQAKRNAYNAPPRKANQEIVDHQRKRQILIQSMKLRARLQAEGVSAQQIEQKVKRAQDILKSKFEQGKMQTQAKDTHVISQAKQKQYLRLSQAFGLDAKSKTGSAFDWDKQRQERTRKQAERELNANKFACPICGKTYSHKEYLQRHIKYKHPEDYKRMVEEATKEERKQSDERRHDRRQRDQNRRHDHRDRDGQRRHDRRDDNKQREERMKQYIQERDQQPRQQRKQRDESKKQGRKERQQIVRQERKDKQRSHKEQRRDREERQKQKEREENSRQEGKVRDDRDKQHRRDREERNRQQRRERDEGRRKQYKERESHRRQEGRERSDKKRKRQHISSSDSESS